MNKSWNRNNNWKGGKTLHTKGYVMVLNPLHPRAHSNGYVMEHILVAEEKIGRKLLANEIVHHIDGDKKNNDPKNLFIVNREQHVYIHFGKRKVFPCKRCGKITKNKSFCSRFCSGLYRYRTNWPRKQRLDEMCKTMSIREIAKIIGVTHNAVWLHFKKTVKTIGEYSVIGSGPGC